MISIGKTLSSQTLFEEAFCCDLNRCKGACCVEGDAGAPLTEDEVQILQRIRPEVEPYMRPEGILALEAQGVATVDASDNEWVTPLVNGKECAYVNFDQGIAKCAIEQAHKDGKVDWLKPLSCHLYPVRVTRYKMYDALNVHRWKICAPACELGAELKMPMLHFLKDALIRAYGQEWYDEALLLTSN